MRAAPPGRIATLVRQVTPLGLLICVYILVGVGRVHEHFSFLVPLRPALLTFLLIVGYVVLNPRSIDLSQLWKTWPGMAVVLLGVFAVLSGIFGISLGATAMFIIEEYASLLIFAAIMVAAVGRLPVLRAVIVAFVGAAAFWLYLSYFILTSSNQGAAGGILRLDVAYTYDPNDICVILNTALPLALLTFRTAGNKWLRRGALLIALGIPGAIALSGSRGGLLGLVFTAAALLVLVREVSSIKKIAGVFAAVLALVIMAPEGYWNQMGTILNVKEDYNWSDPFGRRQVFMRGVGYVMQYPFFGLGADNFGRAEGTIGPLAMHHVAGTGLRFIAPHNTPLQVAADLGLPALVTWLSVIAMGVFWVARQRRRFSRTSTDADERFLYHACTFMPAAWIGFLISSLFVSFAYLVPYYIMLAFTAGIVLAVRQWSAQPVEWAEQALASVRPAAEWRSRRPAPAQLPWSPDTGGSAGLQPGQRLAEEG